MKELSPNRPFLTLEEIADVLGVNYQLIYRLVRSGDLPAVRVGRVYRVKSSDFQAYLEKNSLGGERGFTCGACGTKFNSRESQSGTCPTTGLPICFDCWERQGIRECLPPKNPS